MTTFLSRETVRDALVSLFQANNSWKGVYGYGLAPSVIAQGQFPVLIIRSRGTQQGMANLHTNPTSYRFSLQNWVLADREISGDTQTSATAEDLLDTLDKTIRQVIRDNVSNPAWHNIRFASEYSDVVDLSPTVPYIVETRFIYVDLPNGAI
jgi:hypothetical protein